MDMMDLLKMGATMIQSNNDSATDGLDVGDIVGALSGVLGQSNAGGLDLSTIISAVSQNGLGGIVSSWIGSGENLPISPSAIVDLLGNEKIAEFASKLGISTESATGALAGALPAIVDKATPEGDNMLGNLLDQVGGVSGAMGMLNKFF